MDVKLGVPSSGSAALSQRGAGAPRSQVGVPPGYRRTDVGVIPEDWHVAPLATATACLDGLRVPLNEAQRKQRQGDIPYCGANGVLDRIDGFVVDDDIILVAEDGGYFDDFATRPIAYRMTGKCWVNNHAHILKAVPTISHGYVFYSLVHKDVRSYIASGTRSKLNRSELDKVEIALPPTKTEQQAIAEALSDADTLIESLQQVIAKRRAIKQGAMQAVLTGRQRLPGCSGEWQWRVLQDVATIDSGINKPVASMGRGSLYVTVQDLYAGNVIDVAGLGRIDVSRSEIERFRLLEGDIVFGKSSVKREGIGYPSRFAGCAEPVVPSGFTYRARPNSQLVDSVFLLNALRLDSTRAWVVDNAQASALTNINRGIAGAIPLFLPGQVEQTAIAAILSDMDAAIDALEARLVKTRALKAGMMQQLLTGRIRLRDHTP